MRNLFFATIFLLLVLSCGPEAKRTETTYILSSELDIPVTLQITSNFSESISVTLNEFEVYRGNTRELTSPDRSEDSFAPSQSLEANTLTIIFSNERSSFFEIDLSNDPVFFSEPINRNPFRHGSYENIGNDEFLYTITQEDFENAMPCDGPCE